MQPEPPDLEGMTHEVWQSQCMLAITENDRRLGERLYGAKDHRHD